MRLVLLEGHLVFQYRLIGTAPMTMSIAFPYTHTGAIITHATGK